jgi:hypothetical protein
MTDYRYSIAQAESKKSQYVAYDNIDFKINEVGRKFVGGTGKFIFKAKALLNNSLLTTVSYEPKIGGHSFIDTITTSTNLLGQIESIRNYSRLVKTNCIATVSNEDLNNSHYAMERRVPDSRFASNLFKGVVERNFQAGVVVNNVPQVAPTNKPLDFCVRPYMAMNSFIGDTFIPFSVLGETTISIILPKDIDAIFGDGAIGSSVKYELTDIQFIYQTVADDGSRPPNGYFFKTVSSLKSSLQSSFSTINTTAPIVASSFYATMISQADEINPLVSSLSCQRPPNVSEIQYLVNDSLSTGYMYSLRSEEEILHNFVMAIAKSSDVSSSIKANEVASGDSYGIGLSFNTNVDLSNNKIGINITSDITNANPFSLYMFFSGVRKL